ncbi:MAG: hypothetical protein L3J71_00910 [Victivallaceae bacterium]|nr:hypothetical protein [Victivallaceae bacterium]
MRLITLLLGIFLLLSIMPQVNAKTNETIVVKRLKTAPELDGIIDEDMAWKNIQWNKGLFYILKSSTPSALQTKFKLGYNAAGIYLAVQCLEPQIGNMLAEKSDMEKIWQDDSVEIWLNVGKSKTMHLVFNSVGAMNNLGSEELLDWSVAVFLSEKKWTAEIFIPYEMIKKIPGNNWKLGICRNIQTLKSKPYYTAWRLHPPAINYSDLFPMQFSSKLSKAEQTQSLNDIRKKSEELKDIYSLAVVYPGKGLTLLTGRDHTSLLARIHGNWIMPQLTPSGDTIYFNSKSGKQDGVWKINPADKKMSRICNGSQVACSNDAKSIVFQRHGQIISRVLNTGKETIISPESWMNCAYPSFMADGRIIFITTGKVDKVYLARAGEKPQLLFSGELNSAPRCSPDGNIIAYQNGAHLWLYDITLGKARQLTRINGIQRHPSWTDDSKKVIFSQTFDQFSSVGDIYIQDIIGKNIKRICQDVDGAPGFSGNWTFNKNTIALPAAPSLRWITSNKPIALPVYISNLPLNKFQPINVTKSTKLKELAIDCGNTLLVVSTTHNKILWVLKTPVGKLQKIQLLPRLSAGRSATKITAIKVARKGTDQITCKIKVTMANKQRGEIILTATAGRPVLKIITAGAVRQVELKHKLKMVIGTDRYAWDLQYLPKNITKYPVTTAYSPLMMLFPESEDYLFMLLRSKQTVQLLKSKQTDKFSGISVKNAKRYRHFYLLGLIGRQLWGKLKFDGTGVTNTATNSDIGGQCGTSMCRPSSTALKKMLSGEYLKLSCSVPAALQWRYSIAEQQGNNYSGMFNSNAASSNLKFKIPILTASVKNISSAFYYPYDRVKLTPLQQLTPMDLIINAIGLSNTAKLLDLHGLRQVRVDNPKCFYKDYRIILNWYKWTYITQTSAADTACRMADNLSEMFNMILTRNMAYQQFWAELKQKTAKSSKPKLTRQLNYIIKAAVPLRAESKNSVKFNKLVKKFKSAAKKFKARQAKKQFATDIRKLFEQEINNLQQYRLLVRQIRMISGRQIALSPAQQADYEQIRNSCRKLLLSPVYHENKNSDENIINQEIANYDKTK